MSKIKEIVSALEPGVVIPMHYRSETFGYPVIGTLDAFTNHYDNLVTYESNTIEIDGDTPAQTAVLTL